jgi:L-iditol 2-dehydrogenase
MKSALLYGPKDLRVADVPVPTPGEGALLVKVEACGVCPGDARAWALGIHPGRTLPANLGHEATGVVVEAGSATDRRYVGRRVFADGFGGYAEFKLIDRWTLERSDGPTTLPDELGFEAGVFVEPLADCLFAVEQCALIGEATVAVVVGCGQMGLQLVRLCVLAGVRVVACEPIPARGSLAQEFGAARVVSSSGNELADAVAAETGGRGADCSILACADPAAAQPALAVLREGGRCVFFSAYEERAALPLDLELIHRNRLQIVGSRWIATGKGPLFGLYERAAQLLARRLIAVDRLVDRRVSLDGLEGAFDSIRRRASLKVIVRPGD